MAGDKSSAYDNAGPAIAGIAKDFEPQNMEEAIGAAIEDQIAYDCLGPLTRKAMKDSAVRWSAAKALEMAKMQSRGRGPFVMSPQIDSMMAQMIKRAEPGIVDKIRVSDEAVLLKFDPKDAINRVVERAMVRPAWRW